MSSTAKRTLSLLLWLGLVGVSVWPVAAVDRALGLLAAPLRPVSELAGPLFALRGAEVRAAQRGLLSAWDEEAAAAEALIAAQARAATPRDPSLVVGRRLVHAEVIGRAPRLADRLRVRVRDARGLSAGLPVVHGEVFVGRVHRVGPAGDLEADQVEVDLVTGKRFRVGARVQDEVSGLAIDLIVGGLADVGRLAVQSPSDRTLEGGVARVHARLATLDPTLKLAQGYVLGRVARDAGEQRWSVACERDYRDGLFHLVVLAPPDPSLPSDQPMPQAITDQGWRAARPLSHGDPSPWRMSVRVSVGSNDGARPGAAVAFGARLVGKLTATGPFGSSASLLGDLGFEVVAVARFANDDGEPRVIGRLVSLGRDEEGRVVFLARGGEPLDLDPDGLDGCRAAQLFTGAGDRGVPSGLLLGEARIAVGTAPPAGRRIALTGANHLNHLRDLWVRVEGGDAERRSTP